MPHASSQGLKNEPTKYQINDKMNLTGKQDKIENYKLEKKSYERILIDARYFIYLNFITTLVIQK